VEHLLEELFGVLFNGDVHLHLECMRSPIGVVGVGIVLRRTLREPPSFALGVDLIENRCEADALGLEPALKTLQRGRCQLPGHEPLRCERAR